MNLEDLGSLAIFYQDDKNAELPFRERLRDGRWQKGRRGGTRWGAAGRQGPGLEIRCTCHSPSRKILANFCTFCQVDMLRNLTFNVVEVARLD